MVVNTFIYDIFNEIRVKLAIPHLIHRKITIYFLFLHRNQTTFFHNYGKIYIFTRIQGLCSKG